MHNEQGMGRDRLTISAVIPTRNRPHDLLRAVESVAIQYRLPDELLIIDQSTSDESKRGVLNHFASLNQPIKLTYIHDTQIRGLVEAKVRGVQESSGGIVSFLEDDIVLEPEYFSRLERGFVEHPEMLGCSGVVTQVAAYRLIYRFFFKLFHRGIFQDPRIDFHGCCDNSARGGLIRSNYLSGGLSAYRREVFSAVSFDIANDFFMLEDIDFSTRAARHFGERFFINPNVCLRHNMSPLNRVFLGSRQRRKLREFLVFYKKRRHLGGAGMALLILLIGLLFESGYQAARARRLSPIIGYFLGVWDGLRWKLVSEPQPMQKD